MVQYLHFRILKFPLFNADFNVESWLRSLKILAFLERSPTGHGCDVPHVPKRFRQ